MSWANEIFRKMSLEEKVGHVIICRGLEYTDSMEKMLREGRLGGVGGVTIRQICNQEPDIQYKLNHHKDHIALSKQIAQNSVTLFENKSLPINPKGKTLLLAVRSDALLKAARDMGTAIPKKSGYLYESVKRYQPDADLMTVEEDPTPEEIDNIMEQVKKYDTVLFVSFVRILSYKKGSGTMPPSQIRLVQMLHEAGKDISTVIVGNPYVIRELPDSGNMLCSYSDCMYSIDAAVDILYGKAKAAGRLPVTINEKYSFGYGLA